MDPVVEELARYGWQGVVVAKMQDVMPAKWENEFVPMAASTNATRLYVGTVKTSRTLLAQKVRELQTLELEDGVKRVFLIDWERVAQDNPAYGAFVRGEIARKGLEHPSIKTEFRLIEIDAEGGLFPERRQALMRGTHPRQHEPVRGTVYAAVLDVGGEDEAAHGVLDGVMDQPGRDFTACHIVAVDVSSARDPLVGLPAYRVVNTRVWHGTRVTSLLPQLRMYLQAWSPRYIVADATGVGQGLVSFLRSPANFGERVVPFVFTTLTKAGLGSAFLSVVETGRFQYFAGDDEDCRQFWRECSYCAYSIPEGEGAIDRGLRWGVPNGQRDSATGEVVHDDRLIGAALVAVLDDQEWDVYVGGGTVTDGRTVVELMDGEGF